MDVQYRPAQRVDLPGMAEVYAAAFPDSLRHFFPRRPAPLKAITDLLEVPLQAEPEAVFVAEAQGRIAGYCLAPAHFSRLGTVALRCGLLWQFIRRWLSGRYGLGLRPLWLLARDKWQGHRERRHDRWHSEAHILSIAVHPDFQGQGLGKGLLRRGLQYLDSRGVERVRLEVRPDNVPARTLYEKHGFEAVGETRDSQGPWLIMIRQPSSDGATHP